MGGRINLEQEVGRRQTGHCQIRSRPLQISLPRWQLLLRSVGSSRAGRSHAQLPVAPCPTGPVPFSFALSVLDTAWRAAWRAASPCACRAVSDCNCSWRASSLRTAPSPAGLFALVPVRSVLHFGAPFLPVVTFPVALLRDVDLVLFDPLPCVLLRLWLPGPHGRLLAEAAPVVRSPPGVPVPAAVLRAVMVLVVLRLPARPLGMPLRSSQLVRHGLCPI